MLFLIFAILPLSQARSVVNLEQNLDQSEFFEGDIRLSAEQNEAILLKNGILPEQRWPKSADGIVRIHYKTDEKWNLSKMKLLVAALEEIEQNTCIRFVHADSTTRDYIRVINDTGCYSYVGRVGGEQVLSLLDTDGYAPHCWFHKTIVHEFMHAIGLWHEQSRYDRDDFVIIHFENVEESKRHNFNKVSDKQSSVYGVTYNYESVMHYAKTAFSENGKITIETKDPGFQDVIGNVKIGHALDYEKIRRLYEC